MMLEQGPGVESPMDDVVRVEVGFICLPLLDMCLEAFK